MMYKSTGKLVYDPKRSMERNTKWWLVLEIDEEICRYLRWQLDANWWMYDSYPTKRKYSRPPHKAHVSIIRGEKPRKNIDQWGKHKANFKLKYEYMNFIRQTNASKGEKDHFFFVDTFFKEYNEMRAFFGLDTERNGVPFKGHITFARVM